VTPPPLAAAPSPRQPDGVLLLDKPAGFSSTQALARAKRLLGARKAGHTGTLDPFATGLLPLVFGEATKFSRFLIDATKSYQATLALGETSTTGDTEGEVMTVGPFEGTPEQVDAVLAGFLGAGRQLPPMHSAVHHQGRRLYDFAREGVEVERTPRDIEIHALRRTGLDKDRLQIEVTCGKGTYIRTLAEDIGRTLGCGAYLVALRRTAVGPFRIDQCVTLESLEASGIPGARSNLLPVDLLVAGIPRLDADEDTAWRFRQGQVVHCEGAEAGDERAVFGPAGRFLGVGRAEAPGRLAPERLMATGEAPEVPDLP
jgi:tRNA pseudouridine55 synthase